MDKKAARAKARRRAERAAELQREKDEVYSGMKKCRERNKGVLKLRYMPGKEAIWRKHKSVETQSSRETFVTAFLAAAHTMAFEFKWGRVKRLPQMIQECKWAIENVANDERSVQQYCDELTYEYGVNFAKKANKKFEPLIDEECLKKLFPPDRVGDIIPKAAKMPSTIILVLYPLYFEERLKKPTFTKIAEQVIQKTYDMVKNNNYMKYQNELLKRTDMLVMQNGSVFLEYSKGLS